MLILVNNGYEQIDIRCILQSRVKHPSTEVRNSIVILLQIHRSINMPEIIKIKRGGNNNATSIDAQAHIVLTPKRHIYRISPFERYHRFGLEQKVSGGCTRDKRMVPCLCQTCVFSLWLRSCCKFFRKILRCTSYVLETRLLTPHGVSQGSVIGPLLFILYVVDVAEIPDRHGLGSHFYADDVQLYLTCRGGDSVACARRVSACIEDINVWMASNQLMMNPAKTDVLWCPTRQQPPDLPLTPAGVHCSTFNQCAQSRCAVWLRLVVEGSRQPAHRPLLLLSTSHQGLSTCSNSAFSCHCGKQPYCHKARLLQQPLSGL